MSLRPLTTPWFHGPAGHEKLWLGCAILWCFVMSLMMPYWHFRGKQNSTGESYTVKPMDFFARTEKFVAANRVGTWKNQAANNPLLVELPLVEPAPGGDAYLVARRQRVSDLGQLDVDQVSHRVLRMVGNAHDCGAVSFDTHPFMARHVPQIRRDVAHFRNSSHVR